MNPQFNQVCLHYQHIKGSAKIISESISRDFHISYESLSNIFKPILSPQIVAQFHTKTLSRDIVSWILSLSAYKKQPKEYTKPMRPRILATRIDVANYLHTQASRTSSWMEYHKNTKQSWFRHFWHQCEENSLAQQRNPNSSTEQSNPPYWMYLHPSGWIFGATGPQTDQDNNNLFFSGNYGATNQWTPPLKTRRPSHPTQLSTLTGNTTPTQAN